MGKDDKFNILYYTPLNSKLTGEATSQEKCERIWISIIFTVCIAECFFSLCVYDSTCACMCVLCLVSLQRGVIRVEINKDESSIFSLSLSDRRFTQKQRRSVIEQPPEMQQTKQSLTPVGCSHVCNSIHMLL